MSSWSQAVRDLAWLEDHDAVTGVAAVIAERRRQVEQLGYDAAHDREHHADGWLLGEAMQRAAVAGYMARHDPVPDVISTRQEAAEAGALLAAEIDRLGGE